MPKPSDALVRPAAAKDLDAIESLWEELISHHHRLDRRFWRRAPDGRRKFHQWMEEALRDPERAVFVAASAGRVIGFVHGMMKDGPPPLEPKRGGFITDMTVAGARRRRGIGRKLAGAVGRWFAKKGAREITLNAAVRNEAALAFWRDAGFEPWTLTLWKPLGRAP